MAAEAKYDMKVYPVSGLVRSASDGAGSHQVTLASCDCGDFINRKGRLVEVGDAFAITVCKHVVEFAQRVGGWTSRQDSEWVPDLTHDEAVTLLTGERVRMGRPEARAALSALTTRRTESSDFTGRAGKGRVTYDPARARFTVTILA